MPKTKQSMKTVLINNGRNARRFAKPALQHLAGTSLAAAAWLALAPVAALATPYATCLTNDAGTISFRLNESADSVKVVWNGGATENDLGARSAGLHTVVLGVSGTFQVVVKKASPAGFVSPIAPNRGAVLQIGTDTNLARFTNPRGLAVNTDPASPYFGRVYVANGAAGTTTNSLFGPNRTSGDGIYLLNADLTDASGDGDTARTGGLDFTTGGTVSPYRLTIGQDGNLYISDWSDSTGTLSVTDPNVSPGTGFNVLGGPLGSPFPVTASRIHGSIAAAVVEGSLGANNLTAYVIDEDLQPDPASTTQNARNSLWRHDIGGALPGPASFPTRIGTTPWLNFASQTMDLSRGTNGYFYVNNYRSTGSDRGGLYVLDASGTLLWDSLSKSRELLGDGAANDLLRATGGGAISPAGDFAAVINLETNGITVVPLAGGIPDLTNRIIFHGFGFPGPQGRDVAFDLAGNLYAISSGAQAMRVFSPGGTTVATTGSDGTFALVRPPSVSVVATDALARETGPDTATFSIFRSGDTSHPLTVTYTLTGTAVNGTDYLTNELTATIPIGATNVDVVITPVDDTLAELAESVVLTLTSGAQYDIKAPVFARADIVDNELPLVINLIPVRTNTYEGTPGTPLVFTIERRGETNLDLFGLVLNFSGSATIAIDYPDLIVPYIPPGLVYTNITIVPIDDPIYEGDETVIAQVVAGTEPYVPGPSSVFHGIISDNDYPPAAVLFADNFETDSSANYDVRFGANNGLTDYDVNFSYDYSAQSIPPAPHTSGGTTRGLYLRVNKNDATALGSAGVNVYPLFETFTNNYALRCDMFLSFGTAGTTEHAQLGLNHSGLFTNRVSQSADANNSTAGGDGIWVGIETDGSNNRDYTAYSYPTPASLPVAITNRTATSLASVITAPPYAFAGSPGNGPSNPRTWADVELSQFNGLVTLKVNGIVIYQFPNTTGVNGGTILLGMNDQFDSIGSPVNFVVFDNVQVLRLDFEVTHVGRSGDQVTVDFVSAFGAFPGEFKLQTSTALPGNWVTDTSAVITQTVDGFRATTTASEAVKYFRIVK